jgi:hypothetical protein
MAMGTRSAITTSGGVVVAGLFGTVTKEVKNSEAHPFDSYVSSSYGGGDSGNVRAGVW